MPVRRRLGTKYWPSGGKRDVRATITSAKNHNAMRPGGRSIRTEAVSLWACPNAERANNCSEPWVRTVPRLRRNWFAKRRERKEKNWFWAMQEGDYCKMWRPHYILSSTLFLLILVLRSICPHSKHGRRLQNELDMVFAWCQNGCSWAWMKIHSGRGSSKVRDVANSGGLQRPTSCWVTTMRGKDRGSLGQ